MKIKLNTSIGTANVGSIVDALISPINKTNAVFYDSSGCYYSLYQGQFEILSENDNSGKSFVSLKELIGYDLKSIEFK